MRDKGEEGGVKNLKKWMASFMDGPIYKLKSVFSEIRVRTLVEVVSCQKIGL